MKGLKGGRGFAGERQTDRCQYSEKRMKRTHRAIVKKVMITPVFFLFFVSFFLCRWQSKEWEKKNRKKQQHKNTRHVVIKIKVRNTAQKKKRFTGNNERISLCYWPIAKTGIEGWKKARHKTSIAQWERERERERDVKGGTNGSYSLTCSAFLLFNQQNTKFLLTWNTLWLFDAWGKKGCL